MYQCSDLQVTLFPLLRTRQLAVIHAAQQLRTRGHQRHKCCNKTQRSVCSTCRWRLSTIALGARPRRFHSGAR